MIKEVLLGGRAVEDWRKQRFCSTVNLCNLRSNSWIRESSLGPTYIIHNGKKEKRIWKQQCTHLNLINTSIHRSQ